MTILIFILIQLADVISGHLSGFFTSVSDIAGLLTASGTVALAAVAITCSAMPAESNDTVRSCNNSPSPTHNRQQNKNKENENN
jgi:hypothetical protein